MNEQGGDRMSNSTLKEMQLIEEEALKVREEYDAKIEQSYNEIQKRLEVASKKLDEDTQKEVQQLEALLHSQHQEREQRLEQIMTHNQHAVEGALTNKRQRLIEQIVLEVVNTYGD